MYTSTKPTTVTLRLADDEEAPALDGNQGETGSMRIGFFEGQLPTYPEQRQQAFSRQLAMEALDPAAKSSADEKAVLRRVPAVLKEALLSGYHDRLLLDDDFDEWLALLDTLAEDVAARLDSDGQHPGVTELVASEVRYDVRRRFWVGLETAEVRFRNYVQACAMLGHFGWIRDLTSMWPDLVEAFAVAGTPACHGSVFAGEPDRAHRQGCRGTPRTRPDRRPRRTTLCALQRVQPPRRYRRTP